MLKRITCFILCSILALSLVSGCGAAKSTVTFTVTNPGIGVNIHTAIQRKYLDSDDLASATENAIGMLEMSQPKPVDFTWSVEGVEGKPSGYTVSISKNADMKDAKTYETNSLALQVYNLELGTDYYWTVTANYEKESYTSAPKAFSLSANGPRNLYVEGVTNFRDCGSWNSSLGGRVKQGLIFRCATLNDGKGDEYKVRVTKEGKKVMLEDLGIKTEIDLRNDENGENTGKNKSALGKTVNYYACPMDSSLGNWLEAHREEIKNVFTIFADEANYPIVFHCAIGTDRTGMIAFLLNGLLGVEIEDLTRDYMFSNYGLIWGSRDPGAIDGYVKFLSRYGGETLSERIRSYLLDIGVTAEQIDSVVSIMLDK